MEEDSENNPEIPENPGDPGNPENLENPGDPGNPENPENRARKNPFESDSDGSDTDGEFDESLEEEINENTDMEAEEFRSEE